MLNLTGTYIAGNNITDDNGGGIKVTSGTLTLTGATVSGNTVATYGGGIYTGYGNVHVGLNDCLFTGNVASFCAAIYANNTDIAISGCTFSDNYASGYMAAIGFNGGSWSMEDCLVTNNRGPQNAAVFVQSASYSGTAVNRIKGCRIYDNFYINGSAQKGIYQSTGVLGIEDSIIDGIMVNGGTTVLTGHNTINEIAGNASGCVQLQSGTTLNLTRATSAIPIAPGGGVVVNGGMTVLYNHNSSNQLLPTSSSYSITGATFSIPSLRNDNVVDLGGSNVIVPSGTTARASGCTISGGSTSYRGGCFSLQSTSATVELGNVLISGCNANQGGAVAGVASSVNIRLTGSTITGCSASYGGGISLTTSGVTVELSNCIVSGNTASNKLTNDIVLFNPGTLVLSGSTVGNVGIRTNGGLCTLNGSNRIDYLGNGGSNFNVSVTITSGAILDLTENSNAVPINPGGGITFASGGATVLYSSGTVNGSYLMDNLKLPATAKLTNTNVVNLGGNHIYAPDTNSNTVHRISGCTITGGTATTDANRGGVIYLYGNNSTQGGKLYMEKTVCSGNSGIVGAVVCVLSGATAFISSSIMSGNTGGLGDIYVGQGGVVIENSIFSACLLANNANVSSATATLVGSNKIIGALKPRDASYMGNIYISAGAIVDLSGNANASPIIIPGSGSITVSTGGCKVITSAGTTVSIAAGTYKAINKDGTTTT